MQRQLLALAIGTLMTMPAHTDEQADQAASAAPRPTAAHPIPFTMPPFAPFPAGRHGPPRRVNAARKPYCRGNEGQSAVFATILPETPHNLPGLEWGKR